MIVHTANSVYEIDTTAKKITKLTGLTAPTFYVAQGRPYQTVDVTLGDSMIIVWGFNTERNVLETTITSPIVEIK